MFNFMKKSSVLAHDSGGCEERDGDKDRRKKEKKERKEREKRERIAAGLEEPLRLEEVTSLFVILNLSYDFKLENVNFGMKFSHFIKSSNTDWLRGAVS